MTEKKARANSLEDADGIGRGPVQRLGDRRGSGSRSWTPRSSGDVQGARERAHRGGVSAAQVKPALLEALRESSRPSLRRRIEVVLESFGDVPVDVARDEFAHWLQASDAERVASGEVTDVAKISSGGLPPPRRAVEWLRT